jgi:YHS domain-containing protein
LPVINHDPSGREPDGQAERKMVMKKGIVTAIAVLGLFLFGSLIMVGKGTAGDLPQTKCPVMGLAIDQNVYADFEGKRVYLCCSSCLEKFKADPASYVKKLESQGITLAKPAQ